MKWRVTTKSDSSRIFSNFKSEWRIYVDNNNTATRTKHDTCLVTYEVEMTFASAMFNAVTRQFFDFLVDDIDQQFGKRAKVMTERETWRHEYTY